MRLIDANALMEFARNQKSRSVDCNDIARFPKVDPDSLRPKGRWIYVTGKGSYAEYECDECREHTCFDEKIDGSIPVYNFCPNCGADMREV